MKGRTTMKRLAEIKGIEAVKASGVVGGAINRILRNEKNHIENINDVSAAQLIARYAQNNPEEMGQIFAVLSGRDTDAETNAAVLVSELFQLASDPDLLFFFTLPYQVEARKKNEETAKGQE